jgi:RNA polymerase sigma-70 factor (ECF subfamily)
MDNNADVHEALNLEGLQRRDPDAVAAWFDAFADAVYAFVLYRVGRDREIAADVAQDTFLTALRSIRRYDPNRGAMFPWLCFVARNSLRKALRHSRRHQSLDAVGPTLDQSTLAALGTLDENRLPDEVVERAETAELVRMALSQLSPAYRRSIEEHYFRGRPLGDVAREAGTTEGAAKIRLHRARLAFKTSFESIITSLREHAAAGRGQS